MYILYFDSNSFIFFYWRLRDCEDIELVRLRADIKDLSLAGLSPYLTVQRESVVGISKHLCGAATDLTLRYVLAQPILVLRWQQTQTVASNLVKKESKITRLLAKKKVIDAEKLDCDLCRCLTQTLENTASELVGILIALCCHHRLVTFLNIVLLSQISITTDVALLSNFGWCKDRFNEIKSCLLFRDR